jgi:hypothetical protein
MIKLLYRIKNNPYGYFFLKAFMFFVFFFSIDFLAGSTLRYFYFSQITGERYRTTYDIETTTADIIIFGSSRANHHYHPGIFEKRLNQSCRNVGRDGNFLLYNYAVLKAILKRHTPKIVILDIVAEEFVRNQYNYDNLTVLLPYYKTHPEMRDIIEMKSTTEKIKLLSQIYPYNSLVLSIAIGNTEFNKKRRPDVNGYIPINKKMSDPVEFNEMPVHYEIDSTKLNVYESFIRECQKSNITLIMVCSPYYSKFNEPIYSIAIAKEIARKNNIPFHDYSKDSLFTGNPTLFSDHSHLNDDGALIFSNKLIDEIQKELFLQ